MVSKSGRYKNNEETQEPKAEILLKKQLLSIPQSGGGSYWFRETWEVQKRIIISPALFNLFKSPGKEAHTKLIDYKNLLDKGRSLVLAEH